MFHLCPGCPDRIELSEILMNIFENNDFEIDDMVSYKQWVSTDRTSLITVQFTVNYFIETLTEKIFGLCHHHYIKVQQSSYLKAEKAVLQKETCIILMDFAENYIFLVQDAVQGFYWQNNQATLHPFAVYYKDQNDEIKCDCYCAISDLLQHDQTAVHCFISKLLPTVCTQSPCIKNVKYFTDGAASQYKNYKGLINLMYHENDLNLTA